MQLHELKSLYYDFVYIRAYHNKSPLADRMAEIDERFEKFVKEMIQEVEDKIEEQMVQ